MSWVKVNDFVKEVRWNDTVRAPGHVESGPFVAYGPAIVLEIEEDRFLGLWGGVSKSWHSFTDGKDRPIQFEVWRKE
jgi:hypothetical protein